MELHLLVEKALVAKSYSVLELELLGLHVIEEWAMSVSSMLQRTFDLLGILHGLHQSGHLVLVVVIIVVDLHLLEFCRQL